MKEIDAGSMSLARVPAVPGLHSTDWKQAPSCWSLKPNFVAFGRTSAMGGGSDLQRLSGGENCVLGMATGVMGKACNYPFLVWKNTVQQGLKISLDPRIVYRGLPMACLNLGGTNAVQFGGTGVFQRLLATTGSSQDTINVGGAFLGGAASGLPCILNQQQHELLPPRQPKHTLPMRL